MQPPRAPRARGTGRPRCPGSTRCSPRASPRSRSSRATACPKPTRSRCSKPPARSATARGERRHHLPRRARLPPEFKGDADGYVDLVCDPMIPAVAAGWPTRSMRFAKGSASARAGPPRVRGRARRTACRSSSTPSSSPTSTAPRSPPNSARSPPTISNISTKPASRDGARGHRRGAAPGAFYFTRETRLPPIDALRRAGVPIAIATDCNPGTSPLTSPLLAMNMAATLFRLTVDECIAGMTREAARALGRLDTVGTLEPGKAAISPSGTSRSPPSSSIAWASIRSMPASLEDRHDHARTRRGAARAMARDLSRRERGSTRLPPGVQRAADTIARIAAGDPQSTASTPASACSPASASRPPISTTLQRNLVLSHAAGVGDPMPRPVLRLMMALKLASLGAAPRACARNARPARGDARARLLPVVPAQGSVGASGDLAPLAHMTAAMIGVGEIDTPGGRLPAARRCAKPA
jgi:hypothetical protein